MAAQAPGLSHGRRQTRRWRMELRQGQPRAAATNRHQPLAATTRHAARQRGQRSACFASNVMLGCATQWAVGNLTQTRTTTARSLHHTGASVVWATRGRNAFRQLASCPFPPLAISQQWIAAASRSMRCRRSGLQERPSAHQFGRGVHSPNHWLARIHLELLLETHARIPRRKCAERNAQLTRAVYRPEQDQDALLAKIAERNLRKQLRTSHSTVDGAWQFCAHLRHQPATVHRMDVE